MNDRTKDQLTLLLTESLDIHRTLSVIQSYCSYFSNNEQIFNITHMIEYLVNKSEDLSRNMGHLYDSECPNEQDELIRKFKPTDDFEDYIRDDS